MKRFLKNIEMKDKDENKTDWNLDLEYKNLILNKKQ